MRFELSILLKNIYILMKIYLIFIGAIAYGYSNIFITAPSPENLKTAFEFVVMGLKALKYAEHLDFQVCNDC